MIEESYLDYENAGPKMVSTYKLKIEFDEVSLLKSSYLPIELLHWVGMPAKYAYVVEDILVKHPEYINHLTSLGDNVAFIAAANDNVDVLKVIHKMFPEALNFINNQDGDSNIIKIALEEQAENALSFLMSLETLDINNKTKNGLTMTHLFCLRGNSDMLELLDEKGLAQFYEKDLTYNRIPLYFVIEDYLAHQNNWLFEMTLEKYSKGQLLEKDALNLTVLDFVHEKINGKPSLVSRVYAPLLFSLKSAMGIKDE